MGLFSNISNFFKSSNSLAKTSHQQHMKNVKKSDIKVLEIQRKGTESTVVEIPAEENSRLETYAKDTINHGNVYEGSLLGKLQPLVYKAVLWGIRDLQFYDGFNGSSSKFNNLVINLSKDEVTITITVGGKKHSVTYSNNHFKHSPEYLDNYILPFEDRDYFNRLLESEKENLAKSDIIVFWNVLYASELCISSGNENPFKGMYYIYDSKLGVFVSSPFRGGSFLPIGREDWENLLVHGTHFMTDYKAKDYLEEVVKPKIKQNGGKVGDLQILSSARVYSEVQKLRGKS